MRKGKGEWEEMRLRKEAEIVFPWLGGQVSDSGLTSRAVRGFPKVLSRSRL